jgi:ribosomal peptide maturation radical SAM protein 1
VSGAGGRVLLVVPPFHQLFMPALGVSLLQAELERVNCPTDVLYLNLRLGAEIGADLYSLIATGGRHLALTGEWVFAGDLFGERAPDPQRYFDEVLLGRYADHYIPEFTAILSGLRTRIGPFLDRIMAELPWERYALVGVSSTFQQNCAGLALLQRVKARHPAIRTALGGSNCEGSMGAALHELFPFVDYVCSGEGDRVFPALVQRVLAGEPVRGLPGIHARGELSLLGDETHAPLVRDLDRLPYPNYDDFFEQFAASGLSRVEKPLLVFETSRGCWWGQKHHCTFCGLNGQTMTYRGKSAERALAEIDHLTARYAVHSLYAADPILDLGYFDSVLKQLAERPRPPRLFYETKANLTRDQLRLLARAGVREIQPGIESFSTPVLRLMDKGTTGLQNVRLLKWCAEVGVYPDWNFLCGLPGEDPAEYARLAELIPSLVHLEPPSALTQIRLDRFSPNFNQAAAHGLVNVRAAAAYQHIYPFEPAALDRLAYYFDYDYADGRDPTRYSGALKAAVAAWRKLAGRARLELRLNEARLEIRDSRPAATAPVTVLEGAPRLAYLALDSGNTLRGIQASLRSVLGAAAPDSTQIAGWLADWLAARLVVQDGDRYLSLAVNPTDYVELPVQQFLTRLAGESSDAAIS